MSISRIPQTGATVPITGGGGGAADGTGVMLLQASWLNGGAAIVAADANLVYVRAPVAGTIMGVSIATVGGNGSCSVDVWRDTHANFPPTVADTICGGNKPAIAASSVDLDTTLTGWTTTVNAGDWFAFKLESSSTFTGIFVQLHIRPT